MELNLLLGTGFVLLAAACNGTLALPQKFVRGFAWEKHLGAFYLFTITSLPCSPRYATMDAHRRTTCDAFQKIVLP